jgi:hypothetical protein
MWSGLMQGYEREFDSWHTIEHMPERLGVPGFPRGRRYIATQRSEHAMFILYEGAHIETFRSPGLIARLNDPTEWTKRVQPGLVNFIRGPCRTVISIGEGVGGAVLTIRASGDTPEASHPLAAAAPSISRLHGVTAVHVGEHVQDTLQTAESQLRPTTSTSGGFRFVILVEGIGTAELNDATSQAIDLVTKTSSLSCDTGVYRLAYLLDDVG